MRPLAHFMTRDMEFWAHVRTISEEVGYTNRRDRSIKIPSRDEIRDALVGRGLTTAHLYNSGGSPTKMGETLEAYFRERSRLLTHEVEPLLMDLDEARRVFDELVAKHDPKCPIPMNKQKGKKKTPAYLTGMVNIIVEAHSEGIPCEYNPRGLTTFTRAGRPLRTMARWIDGAFPSTVNPIAVREIKEYYHTTTFGSRDADGVYETLLDGMELQELRASTGAGVRHLLIVDSHFTWWECGRSYLCRMFDMIHMGFVSEILFGREVLTRLPIQVEEWVGEAKARARGGGA